MRLDFRLKHWEDRLALYLGHLIEKGTKSTTLRSYVSAIKHVVKLDKYKWNDERVMLSSIIKACKLRNDVQKTRLPIHLSLLELLLLELNRVYKKQPYLCVMYKALFSLAYYGLMRIGELTKSNHTVKARNVHIANNKNKIMLVLFSSKTHGKESRPQKIKITALDENNPKRFFCPFQALRNYFSFRGNYRTRNEQFFVLSDGSPVKPNMVQNLLRKLIKRLHLDPRLYSTHSFRIGRSMDLFKYGFTVDQIKFLGRWKSNAVYKYLRL